MCIVTAVFFLTLDLGAKHRFLCAVLKAVDCWVPRHEGAGLSPAQRWRFLGVGVSREEGAIPRGGTNLCLSEAGASVNR